MRAKVNRHSEAERKDEFLSGSRVVIVCNNLKEKAKKEKKTEKKCVRLIVRVNIGATVKGRRKERKKKKRKKDYVIDVCDRHHVQTSVLFCS